MEDKKPKLTLLRSPEHKGPVDNGGGGSDNGDMEARIKALETAVQGANDRLMRIETRLDHMPTKSDLSEVMNSQIKWIVGTAAALGAAAIIVMTFVLNNAVPKSAPAQPPVIINMPSGANSPTAPPSPQ